MAPLSAGIGMANIGSFELRNVLRFESELDIWMIFYTSMSNHSQSARPHREQATAIKHCRCKQAREMKGGRVGNLTQAAARVKRMSSPSRSNLS
ncbi:hypothetical protein [Paraburkholderia solisilvae]|uniref:hypothetical protein n=1 Tax=Paraburkholderia solisilvae TaxID=624376 RepID=UPI00158147E5|nr:hypothetical protein [Paraburkholderia solisilvae]